jgi:transcription initiation factor IIE alpha subunit
VKPLKRLDRNTVIISPKARGTSRAAAISALPYSGSIRYRVYEFILRRGLKGATDQEIAKSLNLSGDTVRPTRKTLEQDLFVIDSGTTRNNQNGNACIVWRANIEGQLL